VLDIPVIQFFTSDMTMFDESDSDSEPILLLPDEPEDFLPPPPPASITAYTLATAPCETLTLRLVGHNPLWGHHLWNAGRVISEYLETHAARLVNGKTALELGAGAGLPALTCALRGAAKVDLPHSGARGAQD